jgi:hypothetical protein
MLCPQCGARNPLGAQRCQACGQPFTHAALAADTPTTYAADTAYDDEYTRTLPSGRSRSRSRRRGGRNGRGCLTALAALALVLVVGLVALLALGSFVVKPYVRHAASDNLRSGVKSEVTRQLSTQVGALPDGQVTITDADVNQRIAQNGDLSPIDDVAVAFTPSGVDVSLRAYGLDGTYHATPRVVDGSLRLVGGALDGALGYVVPAGDLESIVNDQLAVSLRDAGYTVNDITLEQGQIVLSVTRG